MGKIITAVAKHNCNIYYSVTNSKDPFGVTSSKKGVSKGQMIELELVSTEKIQDKMIASILGERNIVLKDGDNYVFTYSNDFEYSHIFK